ncbi:glycosyltransferase [Candidatus Sumerlaeota bacterium]|nr:glycosyltransferase [Candidatus Sumerlaeota bacterium]
MKVALVHDWLNGMRGGEKVLECLCDLFPDAPVYALFYEPDLVSEKINRHTVIPSLLQKLPFTRERYRNYLPLFPWAIRKFDLRGFDLVVSSSHCAAKGVIVPNGVPHVCYCHTPMRFIWDKFDVYFGKKGLLSLSRIAMSFFRKSLQAWDRETARKVNFFIANSRYISEKISLFLGQDSIIIPPPVDADFFTPAPDVDAGKKDFFLIVSALVPYKRVDLAVQAFAGRSETLFVAGTGPEEKKLEKIAGSNVRFLGWQSDHDLRELYRNCRALIFTPEEDFGIVPLEAMACGKPVIAFGKGGALDTIVEGKTGLFFMEQTPQAVNRAIGSFDPEQFDSAALRKHAENFSRGNFLIRLRDFFRKKVGISC